MKFEHLIAGYLAIAVGTFGHGAHNAAVKHRSFISETEQRGTAGLAAGMFWPLYWSWTAWAAAIAKMGE